MAAALPPCAEPGASATLAAGPKAEICGLTIVLPSFAFGFTLPAIPFPPILKLPSFSFKLSCDLKNPISITANLPSAALRVPCFFVDPDDASGEPT
jgi:hypothetical protein